MLVEITPGRIVRCQLPAEGILIADSDQPWRIATALQ